MTDTPKYTPGPWHLREHKDGGLMVWPADNSCVYLAKLPDETENDRADARLIAAAPELFEALKFMAKASAPDTPAVVVLAAHIAAAAALAKAEGRGQ